MAGGVSGRVWHREGDDSCLSNGIGRPTEAVNPRPRGPGGVPLAQGVPHAGERPPAAAGRSAARHGCGLGPRAPSRCRETRRQGDHQGRPDERRSCANDADWEVWLEEEFAPAVKDSRSSARFS